MASHGPVLLQHFLQARWRFRHLRGEALLRYQDHRAQAVIDFARQHSAFHRKRLEGVDRLRWRDLPAIDKSMMMARFDDYNTAGVGRDEALAVALRAETERDFAPTLQGLTVGLSSGTSGHRGLFLVSAREQAAWAGVVLARFLPRLRREGYRVAFFLRSNSNLYSRLRSRWIDFRYFDLMQPLDEAIAALNELQPHILAGPPSLLGFLADATVNGVLSIRPLKVVSFAEVLEPQDRERIAHAFDTPVHEVYQCTEGLLAMSCPHGSLHVQEDLVAFETEPLPGGDADERRTPVITDLSRRVQPMIRYRMNDVVTFDPRHCPCGSAFRVLSRIEGRCDDVCYFEDSAGRRRPVFPDTIRRMTLLASPHILDYQAFQEAEGQLRLHLQVGDETCFDTVRDDVRQTVETTLAQYGCRAKRLSIERGLVPVPPRTKRRRVQRLLTAAEKE